MGELWGAAVPWLGGFFLLNCGGRYGYQAGAETSEVLPPFDLEKPVPVVRRGEVGSFSCSCHSFGTWQLRSDPAWWERVKLQSFRTCFPNLLHITDVSGSAPGNTCPRGTWREWWASHKSGWLCLGWLWTPSAVFALSVKSSL